MTTRIRNERWVSILADNCGRILELHGAYENAALRYKTAFFLNDKRAADSCSQSILEIVREMATLAEKTRRDICEHFEIDYKTVSDLERVVDLYKFPTTKSAICGAYNAIAKVYYEFQREIGGDFYEAVLLAQSYLIDGKPTTVVKYLEIVVGMLREIQMTAMKCELTAVDIVEVLKNGVI